MKLYNEREISEPYITKKIIYTNRFLSLDAKELMRTFLFSVNVTEGSRVTIVTSYERHSTHFVGMHNLLRIFITQHVMTYERCIIDRIFIVSNMFVVIFIQSLHSCE